MLDVEIVLMEGTKGDGTSRRITQHIYDQRHSKNLEQLSQESHGNREIFGSIFFFFYGK